MGGGGGGAHTEPRSVFQSDTARFHSAPGPYEVNAIKVGSIDTPAPGEYNIEKEPNYKSPFRHPRQEHLSFGSCKQRFESGQELFNGHTPALTNPGPGEYEAPRRAKPGGAATIK